MYRVAIELDKGRFLNPTVFNDKEGAEELKRKTQAALGEEIPVVTIEICDWCKKEKSINAHGICEECDRNRGTEETICMEGVNRFKTVRYRPTCKHHLEDCIHDPAYIKATYPDWYIELYGDKMPEKAIVTGDCRNCMNGECYDDEDK